MLSNEDLAHQISLPGWNKTAILHVMVNDRIKPVLRGRWYSSFHEGGGIIIASLRVVQPIEGPCTIILNFLTPTNMLKIRWIVFWGLALTIAGGLFISVRTLTICWRLTSLPGIPPDTCAGASVSPLETPVIVSRENTAVPTPTAASLIPNDLEYPAGLAAAASISCLWACAVPPRRLPLLHRYSHPVDGGPGHKDSRDAFLFLRSNMWANIPGFGYSRINTAWTLGTGSSCRGGPGFTIERSRTLSACRWITMCRWTSILSWISSI